jgi:hypothetical protein
MARTSAPVATSGENLGLVETVGETLGSDGHEWRETRLRWPRVATGSAWRGPVARSSAAMATNGNTSADGDACRKPRPAGDRWRGRPPCGNGRRDAAPGHAPGLTHAGPAGPPRHAAQRPDRKGESPSRRTRGQARRTAGRTLPSPARPAHHPGRGPRGRRTRRRDPVPLLDHASTRAGARPATGDAHAPAAGLRRRQPSTRGRRHGGSAGGDARSGSRRAAAGSPHPCRTPHGTPATPAAERSADAERQPGRRAARADARPPASARDRRTVRRRGWAGSASSPRSSPR